LRFIPSATRFRCTDAKVAHGFDGSGKVGRQSRFGWNLPPVERIQPENLAIACHTLEEHPATETSDWREIRRQERGTAYRRSGILMLRP